MSISAAHKPAMTIAPQDRASITEELAARIRTAIRDGLFVPGQRLRESDLMRDFGCSKGPVRETLFLLAGEGIITITPHCGASIRRLSRREMRDSYTILEVLDGLTVRLAAERIDQGDYRPRLEALLTALAAPEAALVPRSYFDIKARFQELLLEMSGNLQLPGAVRQQRSMMLPLQIRSFLQIANLASLNREYGEIMRAMLAGDAATAEHRMSRYTHALAALIDELPDACFEDEAEVAPFSVRI